MHGIGAAAGGCGLYPRAAKGAYAEHTHSETNHDRLTSAPHPTYATKQRECDQTSVRAQARRREARRCEVRDETRCHEGRGDQTGNHAGGPRRCPCSGPR